MRRNRVLALSLGLFFMCARRVEAAEPASTDAASQDIERGLAFIADGEPGCAVAVVRKGHVVLRRARGLANLDDRVSLTPSSVFYIGSMSKQFTAMSIALMIEDGKVGLDDDIRRWLPELPHYRAPIRVRHLLHHTSGLRSVGELLWLEGIAFEDLVSPGNALELLARQRGLNFTPGAEAQYSNTGFFLLGLIVERASGTSLAQFAHDRIFAPLGMTRTQFVIDHSVVIRDRADSYLRSHDGWRRIVNARHVMGDGGVFTTLDDLARWDANFYRPIVGARSAVKLLITPGTLDDGRPVHIGKVSDGYGAGLFLGPRLGHTAQYHGGAWLAYRSDMTRFPDEGLTFVTLCNRSDRDPWTIVEPAAQALLPAHAPPPPTAAPVRGLDAALLGQFVGWYVDAENTKWRRFDVVNGQLSWMPDRVPFDPINDHVFCARPEPALVLDFGRDRDGVVRVESRFPDAPTVVLRRVMPPKHVDLAEYVGHYYSPEVADRSFLERNGKLWSRVRLDEWEPLTPIGPDLFLDEDDQVLYKFQRTASHGLAGVSASSTKVKHLDYVLAPLPTPTARSQEPSPASAPKQ